jgi:hypothetical protein
MEVTNWECLNRNDHLLTLDDHMGHRIQYRGVIVNEQVDFGTHAMTSNLTQVTDIESPMALIERLRVKGMSTIKIGGTMSPKKKNIDNPPHFHDGSIEIQPVANGFVVTDRSMDLTTRGTVSMHEVLVFNDAQSLANYIQEIANDYLSEVQRDA